MVPDGRMDGLFWFCVCLSSHQQLRSYGDGAGEVGDRTHATDRRNRGQSLQSLVYKVCGLSTALHLLLRTDEMDNVKAISLQ